MEESKFNILLGVHKRQIASIASKHTKGTKYPKKEMLSHLTEEFWKCCNDFKPTKDVKLKTYVERRLNNRAINIKKTRNYQDYERQKFLNEGDKGEKNAATFEVIYDHYTDKESVENGQKSKKEDQLELISHLTDPAKVNDPVTTAIVQEWLNSDKPNPTAIGEKLGINHNTVKRKLRKLANNYDELQFGNYKKFLCA